MLAAPPSSGRILILKDSLSIFHALTGKIYFSTAWSNIPQFVFDFLFGLSGLYQPICLC
jgi:hypothetical protein